MENQEKLLQFVEWLGQNIPELKGQGPEQIVSTINELSKSDEGKQMLQGLIQEFESSMTGMFKKGGKLDYLLCLKSGGNIQDCRCGKKIDRNQMGGLVKKTINTLPDLTYRENKMWANDASHDNVRFNLGTFRSAGNTSSFEPSVMGQQAGLSVSFNANRDDLGYNQSPKQYLDSKRSFNTKILEEGRLTSPDTYIERKQNGGTTPDYELERRMTSDGKKTSFSIEKLTTPRGQLTRFIKNPGTEAADTTLGSIQGHTYSSPYKKDAKWPGITKTEWDRANRRIDYNAMKSRGF